MRMEIVISHQSALEFWRSGQERVLLQPGCFCDWDAAIFGERGLRAAVVEEACGRELGFLSSPLHLLVRDAGERSRTRRVVCHVLPQNLPRKSFVEIGRGVYVCRPELVFVQIAKTETLPNAVLIGLEMCGAFRMPEGERDVSFQKVPLTTRAALSAYIEACVGIRGAGKANQAILYIADGSESPMEAKLTIILCFPVRLGGYGLPMPVLNRAIPTTPAIRKATGRSSFRCDLLWPDAGVAVEYDGKEHDRRVASDAIRRTALAEMGIDASTVVTMEHMRSEAQLDLVVKRLSRLLGIRKKPTMRDWSAERHALRAALGLA